jgi:hypothetical protein
MEVKSGRVTNSGTHSTSNDPERHEDISEVDRLAVKLWKEHHEHRDRVLASRLDKEAQDALRSFSCPIMHEFFFLDGSSELFFSGSIYIFF